MKSVFVKSVLASAALLVMSALTLGRCAADPGPRYDVIVLQSLPGSETQDTAYAEPRALNSLGESVGSAGAHGKFQAVRWDADGKIHRLGQPAEGLKPEIVLKQAQSLNDRGEALAFGASDASSLAAPLFRVDEQGTHPITPPAGTQTLGFSGSAAINHAGQVVLNTQADGFLPHRAFLYAQGKLTDLGHLPLRQPEANFSFVTVHALSDTGSAAGASQVFLKKANSTAIHAFLWRQGTMMDLGVPPGYDNSSATALNDQNEVIGTMTHRAEAETGLDPAAQVHGFLWREGRMTDLGALPGCRYTEPTGINHQGQIVGNSYSLQGDAKGFSRTGGALNGGVFLWEDGKMRDLQSLVPGGWQLQSAVGINDRGDILCTGYHAGMPSRAWGCGAFLLRPL